MATQNSNGYSVRDIILRYESEEEEFVRELEQMMTTEQIEETGKEMDEGPPILSVLCSLVDEIGSLRTENRRLKTRLVPSPRSKNVVQRMSAMLEQRGSALFPRLRRANRSSDSIEIRSGARERLSTPPRREEANTNSMTTSTDVSFGRCGMVPLVCPELSGSDTDEQMFNMDDDDHRSRDTTRRCDSVNKPRHQNDHSTSACTSPSSASSSRDPSEAMGTSRSSFLDLLGFRRRSTHIPQSYPKPGSSKPVFKKRRRKFSGNESEIYTNIEDDNCLKLPSKPPRPASYYRRDDSEDSDYLRQSRQRKASSALNVNNYEHPHDVYRVDRETLFQHEKDNLMAEIEELKMRNQRLVEQLRDKSQQQSKLQCQLHKVEMQVNTLSRRCAMSEALDRLTFDERLEKSATNCLKKIEEKLRIFENQMQNAKLESVNAHQVAINATCNERIAHQNCLEKLENLQREHMRIVHSSLIDIGIDDVNMKRRLENLPTYEALYAFTHSVVRRLNEARWAMIEKANEASRAQMDLITTQSSLLVTHAQMERLRIALSMKGKRQRRPASFHGNEVFDRNVHQDLNFYLPFKLQGSRVENNRRANSKNPTNLGNDRNIEEEFLKLFSYSKDFGMEPMETKDRRSSYRIETMMREMNVNTRIGRKSGSSTITAINKDRIRGDGTRDRRPISLVETEERRIRRNEETRRSIKFMKTNSIDHTRYDESAQSNINNNIRSSQDIRVQSGINSPHNTPAFSRRIIIPTKGNAYDYVPETSGLPQIGKIRKLERGFSTESRNTTTESIHDREEKRVSKLQRSVPVSRIKQPSAQLMRFRTMEQMRNAQPTPSSPMIARQRNMEPATRIASPNGESRIPTPRLGAEKRTWFDRLKGIGTKS